MRRIAFLLLVLWSCTTTLTAQSGDMVWIRQPFDNETWITEIMISSDGRYIGLEQAMGDFVVLNVATGDTIRTFPDPEGGESSLSWSAAGFSNHGLVVACAESFTVWDIESGESIREEEIPGTYAPYGFSPDGRMMAARALIGDIREGRGGIRMFDPATGDSLAFVAADSLFDLHGLQLSANGMLATYWNGSRIRIYDIRTQEIVNELEASLPIAISLDGSLVVTSADSVALVWDVATATVTHRLVGHSGDINCMSLSRDGLYLVTASSDGTVRLWDVRTEKSLHVYDDYQGRPINDYLFAPDYSAVALSPDGQYIVSGTTDGVLILWNARYASGTDGDGSVSGLRLSASRPDPITGSAEVAFMLPRAGRATLEVFDAHGEQVATLTDGEFAAGEHSVRWDASSQPAGRYYCRLTSGGSQRVMGLMVVR